MSDMKGKPDLFKIKVAYVFSFGFIPPLVGSFLVMVIALGLHFDQLTGYNWQCGRAYLPSLSRIINLPVERTFWNFFVLFHAPMRFVEVMVGYDRYGRLMIPTFRFPLLYRISNFIYFWSGVIEVLLLITLSLVGEREQLQIHVRVFYAFGLSAFVHFLTNTFCHRQSLYYFKPYGPPMYYTKIVTLLIFTALAPLLVGSFLLYWKKCITWAYNVFALTEYAGIFVNIAYHGCAYWDVRTKIIFCVR